ncbi:unnamed protein product [Candida parapsilosis]
MSESDFDRTDPSKFLGDLIGSPVKVKLYSGVEYRGDLQTIDGYMNVVLENGKEFIKDTMTRDYGDLFLRGNTEKKIGFQSGQTRFSYQQQQRSTMSFVIKRQLSSLIPPKIASAKNLGSAPNAKRMQEVVSFYKKLPQGPAQAAKKPTNPLARYRAAYFDGDNASGKPLLHLAIVVLIFGYSLEYQHLKAHH